MRERFSLPVDLVDELRRRADAEGVTLSELVGRLLVEHLPSIFAELLADQLHAGYEQWRAIVRERAQVEAHGEPRGSSRPEKART